MVTYQVTRLTGKAAEPCSCSSTSLLFTGHVFKDNRCDADAVLQNLLLRLNEIAVKKSVKKGNFI